MMSRTVLSLALVAAIATPAWAADSTKPPDLTIYRSDNGALFSAASNGAVDAGHAIVHEQLALKLSKGTHDVIIDDLPMFIDPEAIRLDFGSDHDRVVSQRLLLAEGPAATLHSQIGKSVKVIGVGGKIVAQGILLQANQDGSLVVGGDVFGPTIVRTYAAVKLTGGAVASSGTRLQASVQAEKSGSVKATLTYPTGGLGWRAVYTGTLAAGDHCRLRLDVQASIANRSGRDWTDADIKLVAGAPRFAKSNSGRVVQVAFIAPSPAAASRKLPQQGTLGDYRTYQLSGAVTLPDGSITLTPLYKPHTVDCRRTWLFENGNRFPASSPVTRDTNDTTTSAPIRSQIAFTAFDALPDGTLRVLTVADDGHAEFIGGGNVNDTPKGQPVEVTLGNAFDLTGERVRTSFNVDRAAHQMNVGFRVTLTNAGATARTVTVREHPWRWRNWTLTSSSIQPSKQTPDMLEFLIKVPAHGNATLDYAVQYNWTAADE